VWLVLPEAPGRLTPDQTALAFAALALPSLLALGLAVYGRGLSVPVVLRREIGRRSSAPAAAPISTV
jgi:hypothetical protein